MQGGKTLTKVIIVDLKDEIVLHSVQIINKESVKRACAYIAQEEKYRGHHLERILIREGFVSIMDEQDEIPIPQEYAGFNR
jgi:hypothetical protein